MYQLVFLLLFDAMLVMTLAHYYRHLGHRYLRYGAMALGAEMLVQTAAHLSYFFPDYDAFFYLSQIARAGFATCILLAVGAVVSVRVARVPLFCGWVLLPAGFVFSLIFTTDRTLGWQATNIPSLWLLLYATFLLGMDERKRTPGILWLTGLTMLHITLLSVLPYILSIEMLFQLLYIVNAMVVILMGFSLVLITSENSVSDLVQQNSRIQEFMREKEQLELQFTEAQKLESLGVLAGGIAHDFNNMLTSILGYASLAMKKLPDDSETRKDLYMVMSGARQAVELTSQMLIYAGKGTLEFEPVDLSRVVDNMSSLVNSIVPRKIAVETKLGNELPVVRGDRVQLGQVLVNLVTNSVDAIEDREGRIDITTGSRLVSEEELQGAFYADGKAPGKYVFLEIRDNGCGIAQDQIPRIFDPFYSDKSKNKGLGLSSLSGIVRQHGGFIRVESALGRGCVFTVFFPVADRLSVASPVADVRSSENPRVLLADDDSRIRHLMASILEGDRFELIVAEDGRDAWRHFENPDHGIQLAVIDCTMPKMSGPEVYRKIREERIGIPVILVSGYHQDQVLDKISGDRHAYFIKKPFTVDDFLDLVNKSLNRQSPGAPSPHQTRQGE